MVWGLILPTDFGRFFPDGDFEYNPATRDSGWRDRLRQHYLAQEAGEQLRLYDYREFDKEGLGPGFGAGEYPFYVTGKFTYGIGIQVGNDKPAFVVAEEHEAPRSFHSDKSYVSLGSLVKLTDRIIAVREDLKELIERLEPSVHQFFPIEISMPRMKDQIGKYYTFVVGQYLEGFLPGQSRPESFKSYAKYPGFYTAEHSKRGLDGLVFDKDKIGNAHIWRERGFRETLTCLSDELKSEIDSAGLEIPTPGSSVA